MLAKLSVCVILVVGCQAEENENYVEKKDLIRPCPVFDVNCIKRYFAKHSDCKIAQGPVPEPVYRDTSNYYYPHANLTALQTGLYITGLTGSIVEFHVDLETELTVVGILFKDLTLNSTLDYYRYHRVGKEPAITASTSFAIFREVKSTIVFQGIDHLNLANSETVSNSRGDDVITANPSAGVHPDPVVAKSFAAFLGQIRTTVAEAMLTTGPFMSGVYFQNVICDFGLKII